SFYLGRVLEYGNAPFEPCEWAHSSPIMWCLGERAKLVSVIWQVRLSDRVIHRSRAEFRNGLTVGCLARPATLTWRVGGGKLQTCKIPPITRMRNSGQHCVPVSFRRQGEQFASTVT